MCATKNEGRRRVENNIRHVRSTLDLNQEQAAKACGVPLRSFQRYEAGLSTPGVYRGYQIAGVFGVSVLDLWPCYLKCFPEEAE